MRHTTYILQNTHTVETKPHTHACRRQMFASALKMWTTTTYSRVWSECAVGKCPCSTITDKNGTSLQKDDNNNATPSGQSSLRSIFNAIIHMRHTTYSLQNTHAIETRPHRDTAVRSILSQIFNAIVHMRHMTYLLQNRHAIEIKPQTHTTVRPLSSQIFNPIIHMRHTTYLLQNVYTHIIETKATQRNHRQVNRSSYLQRNHSHAPHDLHSANYTRNRKKAT